MTAGVDTRVCCGGMICEEHPDRAWPDGDSGCSGPGMPCLHPSTQDAALRAALEKIAALQPTEPESDEWGDCCRGNYDDAHRHGREMGEWDAGNIARAALAASEGDV